MTTFRITTYDNANYELYHAGLKINGDKIIDFYNNYDGDEIYICCNLEDIDCILIHCEDNEEYNEYNYHTDVHGNYYYRHSFPIILLYLDSKRTNTLKIIDDIYWIPINQYIKLFSNEQHMRSGILFTQHNCKRFDFPSYNFFIISKRQEIYMDIDFHCTNMFKLEYQNDILYYFDINCADDYIEIKGVDGKFCTYYRYLKFD